FQFDVQLAGRERRVMEALLFSRSAEEWTLPIWPDVQLLGEDLSAGATSIPCDPSYRDFVDGGTAILLQESGSYEVVTIDTVGEDALTLAEATVNAWPAGTLLYPARRARLA